MEFEELRRLLQETFKTVGWNPTDEEMRAIAREIRENEPETIDELRKIVDSIREFRLHHAFEGVDNSDLDLLLQMATRLAQPK